MIGVGVGLCFAPFGAGFGVPLIIGGLLVGTTNSARECVERGAFIHDHKL